MTDLASRSVVLGNDANVGLLGEWVDGAAHGARYVLGLWLGTGVGGALILDARGWWPPAWGVLVGHGHVASVTSAPVTVTVSAVGPSGRTHKS